MMLVGLGEIVVVVLLRPLRFLLGGQRTPPGRAILRFEHWLLHHLHVINAESQMRYELDKQGQAASFLASGATDRTSAMPSTNEAVQRARRESGADHADALKSSERLGQRELQRGQRQVDSGSGDRSEDIHEAMLQAQRKQRQQTEHGQRLRRHRR